MMTAMIFSGIYGLVFGLALYWIFSTKLFPIFYPYIVMILKERKNGLFPIMDFGRVIKDKKGLEKFRLWKEKKTIGAIEYKDIDILAGDPRKGIVILYSPERGEYTPVKFDKNTKTIKTIDRDQRMIHLLDTEADEQRFKDKGFMEKYGTVVMVGMVFALCVIIVIFGGQYLTQLAGSAQASAVQQEAFLTTIQEWMGTSGTGAPPTPNPPTGP